MRWEMPIVKGAIIMFTIFVVVSILVFTLGPVLLYRADNPITAFKVLGVITVVGLAVTFTQVSTDSLVGAAGASAFVAAPLSAIFTLMLGMSD